MKLFMQKYFVLKYDSFYLGANLLLANLLPMVCSSDVWCFPLFGHAVAYLPQKTDFFSFVTAAILCQSNFLPKSGAYKIYM